MTFLVAVKADLRGAGIRKNDVRRPVSLDSDVSEALSKYLGFERNL